jgi:hypothetical protein
MVESILCQGAVLDFSKNFFVFEMFRLKMKNLKKKSGKFRAFSNVF